MGIRRIERRSPRLIRVTLTGPELDGLSIDQPAASVRLLLPSPEVREVTTPRSKSAERPLPAEGRAAGRSFTPRRLDPAARELDLEIVTHGAGLASEWVESASPGDAVAIAGPTRGYSIDPDGREFVLAGDETAIPAISQLLEVLPVTAEVLVHIEVARPDARLVLPEHSRTTVEWHDLRAGSPPGDVLISAIRRTRLGPATRVWVAGETGAVQQIRRHLFGDRGLERAHAVVRGYWKRGRSGDNDEDN